MPKKTHRQRLRQRWERDPHCYWCGVATTWVEQNGKVPDNAATLDHIRSRFCQARAQNIGQPWQHGIWLLACHKCNHERGALENAWLSQVRPAEFIARGNSPPAERPFLQKQGALANAVLNFLRHGGELVGCESRIKSIRKAAGRLQREYDAKREQRRATKEV